ncbi:MAG: L-serine ammonia-lyase, iron-sulfur-dependent, subunit alpha [Kiritimatiellae bacterium]|nr:L-serine ammonia-lyase, iron-sulfur-dependent, subunit alpha [Kiritimatiellia bacterium]
MKSDLNFSTAAELLDACRSRGASISEITQLREERSSGKSRAEIRARMRDYWQAMSASIDAGLRATGRSASGLSGGDAAALWAYAEAGPAWGGADLFRTMAYGFAVLESNARHGRIVATPTAGSAGIVPACLRALKESRNLEEETIVTLLFTAAGIGHAIGAQSCFSGAEGGCQAEVGSAAGMAAAAVAEGLGGQPEQVCAAAAFALMNTLGLVCDPVGGYVEVPCVARNGFFAVHAFLAAGMALAGVRIIVPLDDVIIAMRDIGRRMPGALRETSEGGLAATPTGQRYRPAPAHSSAPPPPPPR